MSAVDLVLTIEPGFSRVLGKKSMLSHSFTSLWDPKQEVYSLPTLHSPSMGESRSELYHYDIFYFLFGTGSALAAQPGHVVTI